MLLGILLQILGGESAIIFCISSLKSVLWPLNYRMNSSDQDLNPLQGVGSKSINNDTQIKLVHKKFFKLIKKQLQAQPTSPLSNSVRP